MPLESLHSSGPVNMKCAVVNVPEKERTYIDDVRDKIIAKGGDVLGFDEVKNILHSGGMLMSGAAAFCMLFPEKKHLFNLQESNITFQLDVIQGNIDNQLLQQAVTGARGFVAICPEHRHRLRIDRLLEITQQFCFGQANQGGVTFREMLHGHMYLSSPTATPQIVPFTVEDIMLRRVRSARERKAYEELLFESETAKIACSQILEKEPLKQEELKAMEERLDRNLNGEGIGWTTSVFPIARALCVIRAEKVSIEDGMLCLQMPKQEGRHALEMPEVRNFVPTILS